MSAQGNTIADSFLQFDNLILRALPTEELRADDSGGPRQVRGFCFSRVLGPTPLRKPQLVAASTEALQLIGWGEVEEAATDFAEYMCGNSLMPGSQPAAHCYAGQQFGYFSGQLGDGAAMYLGEVVNASTGERWELQLKGSGLTPFSRSADGRKVLRSSVREFLASEAIYHLGIPTTRSASVVSSDTRVVRDPHYDGNALKERCAVITRLAPSFLRFGSFEVCKPLDPVTGRAGPSCGLEKELLPVMVHHTIRTYFPSIWSRHQGDTLVASGGDAAKLQDMYVDWYREVVNRTVSLVAGWQSVGFCHGVLNTDNMSILGLTIDYGPYGFLDRYDPQHVCNGSDDGARYTYAAQPSICKWNLEQLAAALAPVMPLTKGQVEREMKAYDAEFDKCYLAVFRRKLGLYAEPGEQMVTSDTQLVHDLLLVMGEAGSDFTNTFRLLSRVPLPSTSGTAAEPMVVDEAAATDGSAAASVAGAGAAAAAECSTSGISGAVGGGVEEALALLVAQCSTPEAMAKALGPRMPTENLKMLLMLAQRDAALLHQLGTSQEALQIELDRYKVAQALLAVTPAAKAEADRRSWAGWLRHYTARLQMEVDAGAEEGARRALMDSTNPRIVLRNWMAHQAIDRADAGDFSEVRSLLAQLKEPFAEAPSGSAAPGPGAAPSCPYDGKLPSWAHGLCVTCSS